MNSKWVLLKINALFEDNYNFDIAKYLKNEIVKALVVDDWKFGLAPKNSY